MRVSVGDYSVTASIVGCSDMSGNPLPASDCPSLPGGGAGNAGGGSIITTGDGTGLIPGINGLGLGLNNLPNPELLKNLLWILLIGGGVFLYAELKR